MFERAQLTPNVARKCRHPRAHLYSERPILLLGWAGLAGRRAGLSRHAFTSPRRQGRRAMQRPAGVQTGWTEARDGLGPAKQKETRTRR